MKKEGKGISSVKKRKAVNKNERKREARTKLFRFRAEGALPSSRVKSVCLRFKVSS